MELNILELLEDFSKKQDKDIDFFQRLKNEKFSLKDINYLYERLYIRRKFLAQIKNIRTSSLNLELKTQIGKKIEEILHKEEILKRYLEDLKQELKDEIRLFKKKKEAFKAYSKNLGN